MTCADCIRLARPVAASDAGCHHAVHSCAGWSWLGRTPDAVLRPQIAMARGPGEHRHLHLELEEMLLRIRRRHSGLGALLGELPGQLVPGSGVLDVAGRAAQIEGVLVVFEGERV